MPNNYVALGPRPAPTPTSTDRLRVAYVLPSLRKRSGWRTHVRGLLHALTPYIQPVLFLSQADAQEARTLFPEIEQHLLPITQGPLLSSRTGLRLLTATFRAIRGGNDPEVDLVHSLEAYPTGLVGHWLAQRLNRPHVLTCHGTYAIAAHAYLLDRLVYANVLRAAKVVCPVSQGTAAMMQHYFARALTNTRIDPILNGNDYWRNVNKQNAVDREWSATPTLLSVGDVKPRKGQLTSLKAFQKVKSVFPQARYWIVGDPHPTSKYTQELHAYISANHIQDVYFLGYVSDLELERCYREASIFILTPRQEGLNFEGFGLVYLEAGAYGLPVVATNSGGVPDAVCDGETGFLAQEDDVEAVVQSVLRLLGDPDLIRRMGQANRRWAETLTWERTATRQVEVYRSVR
jgi:phosphatidylinositol alpha-1,6-mannosyltransferase